MDSHHRWPELDYLNWKDTLETLHRWVQIVGKIRMTKSPWANHSWNSTFYVTERGLTTSVIHDTAFSFAIDFDFVSHFLRISRSDGKTQEIPLNAEPVASFYGRCIAKLEKLGIPAKINPLPNELPDATPFFEDRIHRTYDPVAAHQFWKALLYADQIMKEFRSRFLGKVSPVHFFWGSFDLAVTRFSGRRAPEHPGGFPHLPDLITRDAYSHEVSSCGFWPGNDRFPEAAFYSYAYPIPSGFEKAPLPEGAFFHPSLKEFILPYRMIRSSSDPSGLLLHFFQSTYEAVANLACWDRHSLEESPYLQALQGRVQSAA